MDKLAFIDGTYILEGQRLVSRASDNHSFYERLRRILELEPKFLRLYINASIGALLANKDRLTNFDDIYGDLKIIDRL